MKSRLRKIALMPGVTLLTAASLVISCGPGATTGGTPTKAPSGATPSATKPAGSATQPAQASPGATKPVTTPGAATGDPVAGRAVFQTNCESCHPGGRQGVGPALSGVVGRLGEQGAKDVIRKGRTGTAMPAFPESRINEKQLDDLLAYLRSL